MQGGRRRNDSDHDFSLRRVCLGGCASGRRSIFFSGAHYRGLCGYDRSDEYGM